jgi:hypothetical protein
MSRRTLLRRVRRVMPALVGIGLAILLSFAINRLLSRAPDTIIQPEVRTTIRTIVTSTPVPGPRGREGDPGDDGTDGTRGERGKRGPRGSPGPSPRPSPSPRCVVPPLVCP